MATYPTPDDQRCTAWAKRNDRPDLEPSRCGKYAMRGQTVCNTHGGMASQNRRKAKERMADQAARGLLAAITIEPVTDPLTLIADLAGEAVAFKRIMRDQVDKLTAIRFEDAKGAEQLRSEIAVYERAMDRCQRFVAEIVKLNLAERMTKVTENHALLIRDVMMAAMRDARMTADQQTEVMGHVARHLRAI